MARNGTQPSLRTLTLVACEAALILLAVTLAAWMRFGRNASDVLLLDQGLLKALAIAIGCQACFYYADLYDLRIVADRRELFVRALQALGATAFVTAAFYFFYPRLIIGRGVFIIAAAIVVLVTFGWRLAFEWASKQARPSERVQIVGTNQAAIQLARELHERQAELGVAIVGFVDTDPARVGAALVNPGIIGAVDDIPALVSTLRVDRVVVCLSDARGKLPMEKLLDMRTGGVSFAHLPWVYEEHTGKIAVENLRPSWLIFSEGFDRVRAHWGAKRVLDVVGGVALFVLALPVMAIAAVGVALSSTGPTLYRQQRVGLNGRIFTLSKFRSMRVSAEAETGAVWKTPGRDPRVTRFGVSCAGRASTNCPSSGT